MMKSDFVGLMDGFNFICEADFIQAMLGFHREHKRTISLYTTLRIDLFLLLCYNTQGGDDMKKRILAIGSILVAIVCVLLILWQVFCFLLINSNGSRSIVINDSNRQKIEQLISQNIEEDGILPNVDNATNVELQSLMHKDQIVVNYDDEDDFVFYITNRYENSLIEYIKSNGNVVYFESKDFVVDLAKTFSYVILLTFAIIVLIKQKNKNS